MSDSAARAAALEIGQHTLLQAPAGSGKTTVLAQRFLKALAAVDDPEEVLAITFTRKAAAEMRERVLLALEDGLPATQADRDTWQALRGEVLGQAATRGWQLAELPQRLRIQTIDSLAHEIARAMPLLGRMQTSLTVVDDAQTLYAEAARLTLRDGEADPELRADIDLLLRRLDNNQDTAQKLLAGMLPARNRWQQWLVAHRPEALADLVAASLQRIALATLAEARQALPEEWWREAAQLAQLSSRHRREAGHPEEGSWCAWLGAEASLAMDLQRLACWQAVTALVFTAELEPRKQVNVSLGFPKTEKLLKERWGGWLEQARNQPGAIEALHRLHRLPPPWLGEDEREALAALARVMLLAGAQLKLVFREHGLVDHSEVAAIARQALGSAEQMGEDVLRHTLRVSHLLVDEFQDTSPEQMQLVRALTSGWEPGERRSLFLVGDPMQSIYLFRDSEVGLFLQTRADGVGEIRLEPLQLTRNFRSQEPLVSWSNRVFASIFPLLENRRSSAVTFLPSVAARGTDARLAAQVQVWPQPADDAATEAATIAMEIRALRAAQPELSIAVLVQTRAVAGPVLRALREAGIATVGVDLAALADRTVVRDLVALGRALLDAGDRIAWLAVLRSPACGLLLDDLLALCAAVGPVPLVESLSDPAMSQGMSDDGRARLQRIGSLLTSAWRARGSLDVATLVENTWQQLGGEAACRDAGELATARQYLLALRRLQERAGRVEPQQLTDLAARLRDRGEAGSAQAVEVLTIHHAKGLEWDVVFVPALGRIGRADSPPLLHSLELPAVGGDSDLLLAVRSLGEPDSSDPLARYIAQLRDERQRNERLRLLYVAITRARLRLYLSGHAPPSGKEQQPKPRSRSLLHLLWPAVRDEFNPAQQLSAEEAAPPLHMSWQRVPVDFSLPAGALAPQVASLARAQSEADNELEFSWVGPRARAAGTVLHAELERLAVLGPAGIEGVALRGPACAAQLREQGIGTGEAAALATSIVRRLRDLVTEERAQWLLFAPHREAASELALSGIVEGELRNVVIDRSFIAAGTRWIIDYKTGQHAGGGLEDFLRRELLRYTPQLRLYARLAQGLGPEPVRTALYFPWLGEFRELAAD
ncbi:MAG: UvrD-helicase domain-containing protein [Steroidobacteraceae bacterium]